MPALSSFAKHPNRYEVLFFAALATSVPTYYVGYEFASSNHGLAICGLITFAASVRMMLHCLAYPKPQGNFFIPLKEWLKPKAVSSAKTAEVLDQDNTVIGHTNYSEL